MTEIELAVAALSRGLIIGLPTDTVYGIAVDPYQRDALGRLHDAKGRSAEKPIPILAADLSDARGFGVIPPEAERYWPGALTVVVSRMPATPSWIGDPERNTVAIRIPHHPVALEVLARTGPLAVTSANRSGEPETVDDIAARQALGDLVAVYLRGTAGGGAASTVVDLSGPKPVLLRPGPVAWEP